MLGVVAIQAGNPRLAIDYITRAIAEDPAQAAFHSNLGEAFRSTCTMANAWPRSTRSAWHRDWSRPTTTWR